MELSFHFNLRLILLALGGLFIVSIFIDGIRRKRKRKKRTAPDFSIQESFLDDNDDALSDSTYYRQNYNTQNIMQDTSDHDDLRYSATPRQTQATKSTTKKQDVWLDSTLAGQDPNQYTMDYLDEDLDDYEDLENKPTLSKAASIEKMVGQPSLIADELADVHNLDDDTSPTLNDLEKTAKNRKQLLSAIDKQRKKINKMLHNEKHLGSHDIEALIERDASLPKDNAAPILTVYSMASMDKMYSGYQLLQSLLSAGLRYGAMNIFHRYRELNGKGPVLFSIARCDEPGTLDIQKMGQMHCQGLTLFMQLKQAVDNVEILDLMLETAHQISQDLEGKLMDDQHDFFTRDSYALYRNRIKRFEEEALHPDMQVMD